jgi:glycosyltransferase involved in cell wall biosynthesis
MTQQTTDSLKGADIAAGSLRAEPAITVVICTHNRYDVLPDAMASIESQSVPPGALDLVVVDNSTDHASQEAFWSNRTLANGRILFDRVPGLSRARNTGLREARAPVIAYMDDDAVAVPEWCAALLAAFSELADAGIVGGPVEPIWPVEAPPWLHKWQRGFLTIVDHGEQRRPLNDNEWLAGTNIGFRTSALREAGGFNEALGRIGQSLLSNEELAVASKIKASGLLSYYEPSARVLHRVHGNRATQQWLRRRVCWQVISDLLTATPKMEGEIPWKRLAGYQRPLPPEMRGIRGLFLDTQDPEIFYKQCEALEAVMYLALSDGRDPESQ